MTLGIAYAVIQLSNQPNMWQCCSEIINVALIEMTINCLQSRNGYLAFYADPANEENYAYVYRQLHTGLIICEIAIWAVPWAVVWYPDGLASSACNICHRLNWI